MWKRLNTRPSQQPAPAPAPRMAIGNPTLIESTLDEESASKLTDLPSAGANSTPTDHHFDRALQEPSPPPLHQQPGKQPPGGNHAVVVSRRGDPRGYGAEGSPDATRHGYVRP